MEVSHFMSVKFLKVKFCCCHTTLSY